MITHFGGYALHVRALKESTIEEVHLDLGSADPATCIEVMGEDMAEGPAAVIDLATDTMLWYDDDDEVTAIGDPAAFIAALRIVMSACFPFIDKEVTS